MIQPFSTRHDKPRAYDYGEVKQLSFNPIEFAISKDGTSWDSCFDIANLDNVYLAKAPDVQPATQTDNTRKVALQDGSRLLSTSYSNRDLTATFFSDNNLNEADTLLGFDALQRFLISRTAYWICFANWPQRMYYVKAKMGKPTFYGDTAWSDEVTFTDLIGLSRSIGSSGDYGSHVLGFGNQEPIKTPSYSFTSNTFTVYNPSDVQIDPVWRGHPFTMTLDGSSSGNLKITNQTTGDEVARTAKGGFSGKFQISGYRLLLNGKSDEINCDGGAITLQKGNNNFKIDNFSGKVTIDFPFWFLS